MSQTSLGMGSALDDGHGSGLQVSRLVPEGAPASEPFFNYVAYMILCEKHKKVALTQAMKDNEIRALWMPFVALPAGKKTVDAANDGIDLVLNRFESQMGYHRSGSKEDLKTKTKVNIQIKHYRLQLPHTMLFCTRRINLVILDNDGNCCFKLNHLLWVPLEDILQDRVDKLWGPAVKEYASSCQDREVREIGEYDLDSAYKCLNDKMVQSAKINQTNVDTLYSCFLDFCFPAFFMNAYLFKQFLAKYDYQSDNASLQMLFTAFDSKRLGYLKFNDFLFGLGAMETTASLDESRLRFVFRYYDTDCDGFLNQSEFKRMVKDMAPKESEDQIQKLVKEGFAKIGATDNVSVEQFVKNASKLKKIDSLCRCPQKPLTARIIQLMTSKSKIRLNLIPEETTKSKRSGKGVCNRHKAKNFEVHHMGIQLDTNGLKGTVFPLRQTGLSNAAELDKTYLSQVVFHEPCLAQTFIDFIKEFNPTKGQSEDNKGYMCKPADKAALIRYLQIFSETVTQIFSAEERLIRINRPAYVIGDICGCLDDLLTMELCFWRDLTVMTTNVVFLGNYAEGGKWGIECLIYLLSLKVLAPNKVFLLRGRYEVRQFQTTFLKECIHKYGQNDGKTIWELINDVLDRMPIALSLDERILCVNSGIPNTKTKVEDYKKLSSNIKDPIAESEDVTQLLFNEPTESIPKNLKPKNGFAKNPNQKNGYLFDESAVQTFIQSNKYEKVLAGNQPLAEGFKFWYNGIYITVFSGSSFKDRQIKRTCFLYNNHKAIQGIQIDQPASPTLDDDDTRTIVTKFGQL